MALKRIQLPEYGIDLYESKHTSGDVVNAHYHDVYQILYILDGEGSVTLNAARTLLHRDHVIFIAPRSTHSIVTASHLTLLVLAFDGALLRFASRDGSSFAQYLDQSMIVRPNPVASGDIRQLLRKMLFEQQSAESRALTGLGISLTLLEILLLLARAIAKPGLSHANRLRADRIRLYIENNYYKPLSLAQLSAELGISGRYINDIFKESYQVTPMQYMTEFRMKLARRLLSETDKEIVSICFEVGYDTLSTFYRAFKNVVHMSPNQYRRLTLTEDEAAERQRSIAAPPDSPEP